MSFVTTATRRSRPRSFGACCDEQNLLENRIWVSGLPGCCVCLPDPVAQSACVGSRRLVLGRLLRSEAIGIVALHRFQYGRAAFEFCAGGVVGSGLRSAGT